MEPVKYPIPQHHLTMAGEGLQELARRLEADAVAFATVATREGALLAAERLRQTEAVLESANFYLGL